MIAGERAHPTAAVREAAAMRVEQPRLELRSMSPRPARLDMASRLRHRPLHRNDVAECIELLPPWLDLDAERRAGLRALWERWADDPAVVTGVQEDIALPPGQRVQSWGATLLMPDDWLDGCPVLREELTIGGFRLVQDTYLDPITGRSLAVDVRPDGSARTFDAAPRRWWSSPSAPGWAVP